MERENLKLPTGIGGLTVMTTGHAPLVRDMTAGDMVASRVGEQVLYRVYVAVWPGEMLPQVWAIEVLEEPKSLKAGEVIAVPGLVNGDYESHGPGGVGIGAKAVVSTESSTRSTMPGRQAA